MVKITVSAPRKISLAPGLPCELELPADAVTVAELKAALAARFPKLYVSRQKMSVKGDQRALADESTLASAGITDGGEVVVKDLGPQISWRTVFIVEYIGPLIIHPLMYHFPRIFFGGAVQHSALQRIVYAEVLFHFLKRELETLFVHRFSHGTMPASFIVRNSLHYHALGGLLLAFAVYSPTYGALSPYIRGTIRDDPRFLWACIAVFLLAEVSNAKTHLILRDLRPAGTKKRGVPYGFGFNLVSCPNYMFEIIAWLSVCIMTGSYAAWLFLVAGSYFMCIWAIKKHKNYKKEFGSNYPKRNIIIPFIF